MREHPTRFRAGLLAAIMAATLQFVLWAGVLSGALGAASSPQVAAVVAAQSPCAPGHTPGEPHNGLSCALCPVCLAMSLPGTLPAPAPGLAPPLEAGHAPRIVTRAPGEAPAPLLAAAYPRGPPLT
jgi:hypothetical protein